MAGLQAWLNLCFGVEKPRARPFSTERGSTQARRDRGSCGGGIRADRQSKWGWIALARSRALPGWAARERDSPCRRLLCWPTCPLFNFLKDKLLSVTVQILSKFGVHKISINNRLICFTRARQAYFEVEQSHLRFREAWRGKVHKKIKIETLLALATVQSSPLLTQCAEFFLLLSQCSR